MAGAKVLGSFIGTDKYIVASLDLLLRTLQDKSTKLISHEDF